jgi:hypothetical protein
LARRAQGEAIAVAIDGKESSNGEPAVSFSTLLTRSRSKKQSFTTATNTDALQSAATVTSQNLLFENVTLLAEQLTLIEAELFCRMEYPELLKQNWAKKDAATKAPRLLGITEHFNKVCFEYNCESARMCVCFV